MNKNRSGVKLSFKLLAVLLAAVGSLLLFGISHPSAGHAATGINQQLNFQGRLLDNTGAVVTDGTYNFEFKIYQDGTGCVSGGTSPCGGTPLWTEDHIQTNRVTVKNGYFSVSLGSITAFGTNINWNSDSLWLSTNVGGTANTATPTYDGEMTPFQRLTSSPYALNSNSLQGLQASNFVQLAQGIQTDSSTVNPSIFINKTGATANILELQSSNSDVFTIANNGDITATGKYNSDTINSSAITFGAASTANIDAHSGQTLQLGASSAAVTLGANTTLAASKSLTLTGSGTRPSSPTKGMLYYDTTNNDLINYNGTKWVSAPKSNTEIVAASNSTQAEKDAADFVATGTDDGATIDSAFSALPAGGGSVYLMEGTYKLAAAHSISVPDNTTLEGSGTATVITIPNSQNGSYSMITNSDTTTGTNVTVENLLVDGNGSHQSSGSMTGIDFENMGSATLNGGKIIGTTVQNISNGWGIYLGNSLNNSVTNNTANNNTGSYGIDLHGSSNNTATGNVANYNDIGILVTTSASSNTVSNNTANNNTGLDGVGIDVTISSSNNALNGNTANNNGAYGIQLYNGSNGNSITSNNADSNTVNGIYITTSSSNNTVTGNNADTNGSTGIYIYSSSNDNTITGNTAHSNAYGVRLETTFNDSISGNTFNDSTTNGIYITGSSRNTVSSNTVNFSTSQGIYVGSSVSNIISANKVFNSGSATANNGIYLFSASTQNSITGNDISDNNVVNSSCTTTCYAINISDSGSTGNFLSDNHFIGDGTHAASINDATTGGNTYSGQQLSESGDAAFKNAANSNSAFQVQNAAGNDYLNVDTSGANLSLGNTGIASTIQIGNTTGAITQNIYIGNNSTGSSTTNVTIGSTVAGTTTIQGGTGISLNGNTTVSAGNTFTANGTALFENSSNSPTTFQIQSATATNTLLTADTQNNKVVVGDATGTNTNTTQFIVDSSTVDPSSGSDGSIYYNSTADKFRCYQGGAWADCLGATSNSTLSIVSGLANVAASSTGTAVETMVFTSATAVSNTAGATGFTAAAGGSFRTCLVKNNANITAGTLGLRWRVNGVSVGSSICNMDSSTALRRQASGVLDAGVVTFSQGDTIGIAFDTNAAFAPTGTNDFTVFWTIEYNSTLTNAGATLQSAYDNSNTLTTTDTHDLLINAADTATDANLLFNLQCTTACGGNGRFAVQNNGVDVLSVAPNSGNITLAPASGGDVVVSADADSDFQVNYSATTDATMDIAHINIVDNANASTGSLYGLAVVNNDNGANTGVPDALAYLKNANAAETVPDGLLVEQTGAGTLTSGVEVKQTAGAITNGLQFTGTFNSVLKVGSNTILGGTGLLQSYSLSGAYSNALTLSNNTNSYSGASLTNTSGGLTLTGAGDSTWSTNSGALTLQSASGTVSFGTSTTLTNTGATLTLTSSSGSDVSLNSNVVIRPGVDGTSAVAIDNAAGTSAIASFGTNTTTSQDQIANPSLENNDNGWTKKGAVGAVISSSDDFAQFGKRSLKMVTTATIGDGASYSVPLKASTQYTLSAWIRVATGTAATINLNRQDNGTDVDGGTGNCTALSVTTTFTQFSCTFTTGATVNSTTNIYIKQTDATIRTIYADGITLTAGAAGLSYDPGGGILNVQDLNSLVTMNGSNSGDLQPWQLSSTPIPTALRYTGTVTANGYIYSVGGCTGTCAAGTEVTAVYYSKINADGSLDSWSTATAMPAGRYGMATTYINGYLYVMGGDSGAGAFGATPQNTVYYTKMNNDGTLGTWQTAINPLTAAREFQTTMAVNGFIYAIGGDNAGAQSTVYYAKAYADGSVSPWTTTTPLSTGGAARRYASTIVANGYVYVIGGDTGGTSQSTVYYNSINGDGTLGTTWAATTALNVGGAQPRRHETAVVVNGYVYVIGGDNGSATQTTVYYADMMSDGTIGTWQSVSNPLPAARYGMSSLVVNGYIYSLGGYDGTNAQATPYYASTERVLIGGSLDLVGLSGQSLNDASGAGSITAGTIRAVGGLTVDGYADFNNGLSVDSALNINAVSADTGQVVFNINNSSSNSIFSVRHMNSNFGSLASAGAFIDNMSYIDQEFNKDDRNTALASATATAEGDDLEWFWKASATGVTYQTPRSINGIAVMNFPTTTTTSGLLAMGSAAGTLDNIVAASNLPVIQMKMATTLNSASSDIYWGVENGTVAAPTANDTPPTDGLFFWNDNAAGPWQGMVRSASTTRGTVNCPGNIVTTAGHYATGRIEVLDATHVHFMMDIDSTDGVNLVDCGTVIVTAGQLPAAQLAPFIEDNQSAAQGAAHVVDIDYSRVWQDDSINADGLDTISADSDSADASTTDDNSANTADATSSTPLTNDSPEDDAVGNLIDFAAASSDDTVFNNDVYVQGTIYANKIVANQIEGIDVITDQISSLAAQVAKDNAAAASASSPPNPDSSALSLDAGDSSNLLKLNNVQAANLTIMAQLEAKGGLIVDGNATFNGLAQFKGAVSFNNDAGGTAVIKKGATSVQVKFTTAYQTTPIITANYLFNNTDSAVDQANQLDLLTNGYSFIVTQTTTKGFTLLLNKAADHDTNFSWLATQIDNPQISQSTTTSSSSN